MQKTPFIVLSSEPWLPAVRRVRVDAVGDWSLSRVKSRIANEKICSPVY